MPKEWLRVPVLSDFGGFQAEIQVRTLAQHIWAEASHKYQYKQEQNIPPTVRRSIYRASALLETIDLEFERILEQRIEYRNEIENPEEIENNKEQILNVDLLESILDSKFPPENKTVPEPYGEVLNDLFYWNIKTTEALNKIIEKHLIKALKEDKLRVKEMRESMDYDRRIYYMHVGLLRVILAEEFGEDFHTYIINKLNAKFKINELP
jgi:hypothetical protein